MFPIRVTFAAVYYNNIWESKSFPFVGHTQFRQVFADTTRLQLSQELFYENGTLYDQLLILNDKLEVDPTLLAEQGLPFYAGTWITYLLTSNIGMAATFTHLLLWNRNDLRAAWSWMNKDSIKQMWKEFDWRFWKADGNRQPPPDDELDPHYREMLKVFFCSKLLKTLTDATISLSIQMPRTAGMVPFSYSRLSLPWLLSIKPIQLSHGKERRKCKSSL